MMRAGSPLCVDVQGLVVDSTICLRVFAEAWYVPDWGARGRCEPHGDLVKSVGMEAVAALGCMRSIYRFLRILARTDEHVTSNGE